MKLEKGKHFIVYEQNDGKTWTSQLLFEGEKYLLYAMGKEFKIDTEKFDDYRGLIEGYEKCPSIDCETLPYDLNVIWNINDRKYHHIDYYTKEYILSLKGKDIKANPTLFKGLIHYYGKTDLDFKIKVYSKNWIFNNELFYDRTKPGCPPIKFSKEQIKEILNCKQFNNSSFVMGGSQMQKQNALNHLLKTQDLTDDLFDAILEKYKDDEKMLTSTISFVIKSNKVKTTSEINKFLAEKIVYNDSLHELVKTYKKKFGTNDLEDDCVKLLLECIE